MAEESNLKPDEYSHSNLNHLKQKARYRNSISTESPNIMLTPPNPDEEVQERRRLSDVSARSAPSIHSDNEDSSNHDANHLLPPTEPEPEDIVNKLISQRRPSTITTLSAIIKQIFIDKKIKEDGIPSKILDGLYLGSIGAAKNLEWLKTNGITHVLCVAGGIGQCFPKQFKYKVIDINDAPNEDISAHFKASYQFIENALNQSGKVLVHCFAGMSRSVTVVSAYLMQKKRMCAVPALKFVKQHRTAANPNAGFIVQLIKFQNIIGIKQNISTSSDDDDIDIDDDEEEEKADKPKKKTLKGIAFAMKNNKKHNNNNNNNDDDEDQHKSLMNHLNSPMVKEWETGRRPSLFTALAKLRGMKIRARTNSTDSTHSNISAMSSNDNKQQSDVTNLKIPIIATHHAHNGNNNGNTDNDATTPISPLDDGCSGTGMASINQAKLHLLKEVSNETDDDNILAANKKEIDLKHISQHIKLDTHKDDDDDAITPLEDLNNDPFPDTNTNENKQQENDKNNKPINITSTQL